MVDTLACTGCGREYANGEIIAVVEDRNALYHAIQRRDLKVTIESCFHKAAIAFEMLGCLKGIHYKGKIYNYQDTFGLGLYIYTNPSKTGEMLVGDKLESLADKIPFFPKRKIILPPGY